MSEQFPNWQAGEPRSVEDNWKDVGRQFQQLGESLAAVFQAAWKDENNRQRLREAQRDLLSALEGMRKAVEETISSPQGQELRSEAEKTVERLRGAGEQTIEELRPQVYSALRRVSEELQRIADRLEQESKGDDPTQPPDQ